MKHIYIIGIGAAICVIGILALLRIESPNDADQVPRDTVAVDEAVEEVLQNIDDTSPPGSTADEKSEQYGEAQESATNETTTMTDDVTKQTEDTTVEPVSNTTMVVLKTNKGDITIELLTGEMPVTAGNFLKLAKEDFYDGVKFHRVIDGFMIQGGDPLTKDDSQADRWGTGGPGYAIPDEFGPRYSNRRGTLSMANAGPNTGGSQFFINTADNTFLDGKHPVFGRVTAGMDVIDIISKTETAPGDVPVEPIVIKDIVVQ